MPIRSDDAPQVPMRSHRVRASPRSLTRKRIFHTWIILHSYDVNRATTSASSSGDFRSSVGISNNSGMNFKKWRPALVVRSTHESSTVVALTTKHTAHSWLADAVLSLDKRKILNWNITFSLFRQHFAVTQPWRIGHFFEALEHCMLGVAVRKNSVQIFTCDWFVYIGPLWVFGKGLVNIAACITIQHEPIFDNFENTPCDEAFQNRDKNIVCSLFNNYLI